MERWRGDMLSTADGTRGPSPGLRAEQRRQQLRRALGAKDVARAPHRGSAGDRPRRPRWPNSVPRLRILDGTSLALSEVVLVSSSRGGRTHEDR